MAIHPARQVPFGVLMHALDEEVSAGRVSVRRDGPLALFNYRDNVAYERTWNQWNKLARGLILDLEAQRVVATPFPKFFNLGEGESANEPMAPLPDEAFEVTEKVDGSLGILHQHRGRWRVVTRGSFTSDQARWAQAWFDEHILPDTLDSRALEDGATYLVEIVYPENRIVVPYDFAGLVLLAAYGADGQEYSYEEVTAVGEWLGWRVVPRVPGKSIGDLLELCRTLPSSQEGFVVRFASGRRVKLKGDEYCRVHRLVSHVTPLAVWETLAAGDGHLVLLAQLPEEFRADYERIHAILSEQLTSLLVRIARAADATSSLSDKELGLALPALPCDEDVRRWIFPARKKGLLRAALEPGNEMRRKVCETFRPTGNVLAGYTPSTAMNRFQEEQG